MRTVISSQTYGSNVQRVSTLGDWCWLPNLLPPCNLKEVPRAAFATTRTVEILSTLSCLSISIQCLVAPTGLFCCATSPPLTEVSRAIRARNAEKVWKMSPGPPGPGTPKSLQKVSGTVWEDSGESSESVERLFSDCSWDFLETFRGSGAGGPGDIFETFSAFGARRARETSARGGLVRNSSAHRMLCESSWTLGAL